MVKKRFTRKVKVDFPIVKIIQKIWRGHRLRKSLNNRLTYYLNIVTYN